MAWDKILKVGKTERYTYDVTEWLSGETLTSAQVTASGVNASISSVLIDGDTITFLATGLQVGTQELRVNFSTATRTDTSPVMKLKIKALPTPV